ncbi:MAG TPA: hypothetical protein PKL54_04470 [Candidatus Hydrogenedentes bacterium]|nr:hypothetical protein [Candidatus Hydrogenedentota bacterium]HOC72043.1 hypothetical protein [Candidatus Hydrogenedentota bacterium]HOH52233.1 hypothetical protein [Candidatus Hydrogenedentota bacterium]
MDKKGLVVFLLVTFGLGAALLAGGQAAGFVVHDEPNIFHSLYLLAVMWVPAVGALAASLAAPGTARPLPRIWPVPAGAAARLAVAVPLLFAAAYGVNAAVTRVPPQWGLSTLLSDLEVNLAEMPEAVRGAFPGLLLGAGLASSVLLGCVFFSLCVLGLEIGWRGYLLPRLLPLGRVPAHLVSGTLWALWFLPLPVGYALLENDFASLPMTLGCGLAMALALTAFLNEIVIRRGHLGLSALALGLFVSQQDGMWPFLFPAASPPFGGTRGLLLTGMFLLAAVFARGITGRTPAPAADAETSEPAPPKSA